MIKLLYFFLNRIAIYFSPLLTVIQIFKFFILFYVKKVNSIHIPTKNDDKGKQERLITITNSSVIIQAVVVCH